MGVAEIPGLPYVRASAGQPSPVMMRDLVESFAQEPPGLFRTDADGRVHYAHLALSGGGPNGAFGAGFLKGWTETGNRPTFKIVTGVSTGALIAPFALLGPKYDAALHEFYTTTASRNIFRLLSIVPQLLGGESLAETGPLQVLIAQHVDEAFLREIAAAHARGQRLYVATVNLDSQRFVVWNMGLIAKAGALDLFRDVLLASSSVPVAFPPVFFAVEADGRRYDEMHVDGSVGAFVFYSGGVWSFAAAREAASARSASNDIFVIHNGQLPPNPQITSRSLRSIALRVFESAGRAAVVGDLFRIYSVAVHERSDFHWMTIPPGVEMTGNEVFDPAQMQALYDLGYRMALEGPRWRVHPPGFGTPAEAP
ncbi:MAG: patatin-like phospholipase family protein [Burkholderiales bacterium]|nr:patatin-like phospholipase family protein [Burkholderiales bacterium]